MRRSLRSGANNGLPKGWTRTTLGDIAAIGAGDPAPQGAEFFAPDGVPFVRVRDMGTLGEAKFIADTTDHLSPKGRETLTLFPQDTVLFTKSGMSLLLNQRAVLQQPMCVVSHIGVLPPTPHYPNDFIYYWLKQVDFASLAHATTLPSLPLSRMEGLPFLLPPLAEQRRIVAKIEELFSDLDAGVDALKKTQALLKRYRQSVLKAAFEGKLTATWRATRKAQARAPIHFPTADPELAMVAEAPAPYGAAETAAELLDRIRAERQKTLGKKFKELPPLDTSDLPPLPEGWAWTRMVRIVADNPQNGLYVPKDRYGGGTPILRINDYQLGWSRMSAELQKVEIDEATASLFALAPDDIVVNRVNSPSHLGKSLCISSRNTPAVFESNMMRFRIAAGIMPQFVQQYLGTVQGRRLMTVNAKWAVNQASINQQDVLATAIPIAPPDEQGVVIAEIERRFAIADRVEETVAQGIAQSQRLRQSILKRAFSGRLVPQDPKDEPADKLLERIGAAKGADADEGKTRRQRARA